jgi:hypothetical protein
MVPFWNDQKKKSLLKLEIWGVGGGGGGVSLPSPLPAGELYRQTEQIKFEINMQIELAKI